MSDYAILSTKLDSEENYIIESYKEEEVFTITDATKQIIGDAIPATMGLLFIFIAETINIIFIGKYNNSDMIAGVGIGTLYINATGYVLGAGLIGGLDTLCSQSFGNCNFTMVGIYTNITRIVITIFFFLMSLPFTIFSKQILIIIGQEFEVSQYASDFCHSMLPSLFFALQYNISLRYLQAINIFKPGMLITLFTVFIHPIWCYMFIYFFNFEILGAGIAMSITQLLNLIIISVYIHKNIPLLYPETYFFINRIVLQFEFFTDYLKKAVPASILFSADWLGFEILTLMSSYISPISLAANVVLFNFITMIFMIPMGLSFASTTLVGISIGGNQPKKAKIYAKAAVTGGIILIGSITLLVFIFKYKIPYLYTENEEIAYLVTGLLKVYVCFSIVDAIQIILHGVIKGLGKQKIASIIALIILYPINIPLAYSFGFLMGYGLNGLWYSQLISVFLLAGSYILVITYYDWSHISEKTILHLNEKRILLKKQTEEQIIL